MRQILSSSLLLLVALALAPAFAPAATAVSYTASSEGRVLVLLNGIRHAHRLAPLAPSIALRSAAREHTTDMLRHGYFEHDSSTETFDKRIHRHLASSLVGENIAWGTGRYGSPEGLVRLWMHSPSHRRIILMAGLHRVGLGIARGSFKGQPGATMATADFSV